MSRKAFRLGGRQDYCIDCGGIDCESSQISAMGFCEGEIHARARNCEETRREVSVEDYSQSTLHGMLILLRTPIRNIYL